MSFVQLLHNVQVYIHAQVDTMVCMVSYIYNCLCLYQIRAAVKLSEMSECQKMFISEKL